jgi:5'-methylthioadenosine phosphorylase
VLTVGIIGGSGLYDLPGLEGVREVRLRTPFGDPSDVYSVGRLGDVRLAFLPRHGRGHRWLPHEINVRANIWGFKKLGADRILSVSAVGSMREHIAPGDVVIVDQFIDRTRNRISTFFGGGIAGHVSFADPVCTQLAQSLREAAHSVCAANGAGAKVHDQGTYLCIDGPAFSTRAESFLYRQWGVHVIGMTNIPEAKLAREAEICYATLALPTDYDCWHESEEEVSVAAVIAALAKNAALAREIVAEAAKRVPEMRVCACANALEHAVITNPQAVPRRRRLELDLFLGKYLRAKPAAARKAKTARVRSRRAEERS